MSSHDLSLNSINKNVPIKPDTKTAAVEKQDSEGFVEELKELMGFSEKEDVKKAAVEEKSTADDVGQSEKKEKADELEKKEDSIEEKVGEGSELLSRLEQANGTLVDRKKNLDKTAESSEKGLNSSKAVGDESGPIQDIQWGKQAKAANGETQPKGDASGNKESNKELLTSTTLIGKAEAESGKLAEAKKAKLDISALGMTDVVNGQAINLTESKTTDSFAQQLATASGTTAAQQATSAQKSDPATMPLNIRQEQVSDEVAERINMMMAKNLKHVDIRLDPPEMGRMHIRLNMGTDSAGVQFTVSNQQARDAIEQSLPRLREMFAQQGIQLADTSVQQQSSGDSSQYGYQKEESSRQGSGFGESSTEEHEINVQVSKSNDGISFYA
jgi:flagellar hook-length control protein FliK